MTFNTEHRSHPFAQGNVHFLHQALDLLADLTDDEYVRRFPPSFTQGIGVHIRHIVDHYRCFLSGLAVGRVDYDARGRDRFIETDRSLAADALRDIMEQLWSIAEDRRDPMLEVQIDCGASTERRNLARSTVARELQFLVSHTVHHYALVAIMLRLAGREPAREFGIAPSTIRRYETLR